jgi:hypothetical protein
LAEFPPPTWTVPIEFDALFEPLPPIRTGAVTCAAVPAAATDADGVELIPLACTVPAELEALLPPPTCAVPIELEALLFPDPPTDVGAETDADAGPAVAPADGSALVLPT